jgi:hypothetical protein
MSRSMSGAASRRLALAAVAALGLAGSLAAAGPAAAAQPANQAAFATVTGTEVSNFQNIYTLPEGSYFSPTGRQILYLHNATGIYTFDFPGFTDPKVVYQVQALEDGTCQSEDGGQGIFGGDYTGTYVDCFDENGARADLPFTISVSGGGAAAGGLVSATTTTANAAASWSQPASQHSSVGGAVTMSRKSAGTYTFLLPYLPGAQPDPVQVSAIGKQLRYCAITGKTPINGNAQLQVDVSCSNGLWQADTPVSITYTKGVNLLGSSLLSTAYLSKAYPFSGTTVLGAANAYNHIYGGNGYSTTLIRVSTGQYLVRMQNQDWAPWGDTFHVTSKTVGAHCVISSDSWPYPASYQQVGITCLDWLGAPKDAGLEFSYAAHQ